MEPEVRRMDGKTLDEVTSLIAGAATTSQPGAGTLVFVRTGNGQSLRKLASTVAASRNESDPYPVFLIPGDVRGKHGWPFARVRTAGPVRLFPTGDLVSEDGGVIFPQDRPVVLLVEAFDFLEPVDQRAYAHLVDGEGHSFAFHEGSILIGGVRRGDLEAGIANRGIHCELV